MSSQFDDLLGDFGDTSGSATIKAGGDNSNGAEDSGLLVDFSVDSAGSEVTNGQTNGVDHEMANPLYDFSTNEFESQSSNPLYDFSVTTDANASSSTSGNPLYDLTTEEGAGDSSSNQQSSADLFDFGVDADTTTTSGVDSANPLYEFDSSIATDEGQLADVQSDDLFSGTNSAHTTTQSSDQYADLLGDFSNNQQQEYTYQNEQEQEEQADIMGTQEYSGADANGGGMLLDSGPTDTTTTADQGETIVTTTTYQDEIPNVEAEEVEETPRAAIDEEGMEEVSGGGLTLPDLIVTEDGDEEVQAETEQPPVEESHPEPQVAEPVEESYPEPEDAERVEESYPEPEDAERVEESYPEPEHVKPADEFQPEPEHVEEVEDVGKEPAEPYRPDGDGEEQYQEEEHDQVHREVVDSTGTDGAYHADRREEDLEQYCMYREEETSEVSDGIGEAAATEEREHVEAPKQEEDQTDESQGQTEEVRVHEIREEVPVLEHEEAPRDATTVAPEQEEEDPSCSTSTTRPTSFTSSSSIVLLASPTSPPPGNPFSARLTIASTASVPPRAVTVSEEEVIQDGRTVTKTTRTENRYSGSGPDDFKSSAVVEDNYNGQYETAMNKQPAAAPKAAPRGQQPATLYDDLEDDDEEEEGVYENEPEQLSTDVVRASDKKKDENLPVAGNAQSLRAKFAAVQEQSSTPTRSKREVTPPNRTQGGGEYVSEPRVQFEQYEGRAESGVFESQPVNDEDVVKSGAYRAEPMPEQGYAKNVLAKFQQLESDKHVMTSAGKREITPDRSNRVECVSEPRSFTEHYEGKAESGVFESQPTSNPDIVRASQGLEEARPERGTAKNLADRFRQISQDNQAPQTSRTKREITPDASGRVEYVTEPRTHHEAYQSKTESGVFENQPQEEADVVKSEAAVDDYVPERGSTKNVAARFKELESNVKSPPLSPGRRKEFTPPREDLVSRQSGVYESTPQVNPEVVTSNATSQEVLPEQGTARNIAQRYRQLEAESKSPPSPKGKKEFTPPPRDTGVFENQPERFQPDYNRPTESGTMENQPQYRDDVTRESEPPKYAEELPERGMARNLVSRWKQMENDSAKSPGSGVRQKEFTPPREEPRIAQQSKSPRTPKSPPANSSMDNGSVHPSELPGQYQPQNEPSVTESTPDTQRSDVHREADTDKSEGMPKKNAAKKMLARFQNIQAEANKETPRESRKDSESESDTTIPTPTTTTTTTEEVDVDTDAEMQNALRKFEDPDKVGRSKSMRAAIQVEKCGACDKTVYAMERLEMNKRVYHRACFRCSQCKSVLTPKTFAINNEVIYCTTHYKQLFTRKGNYDEGFGRTQHKKMWNSNPNIPDAVNKEEADRSPTEVNS